MPHLSWNQIRTNAARFAFEWKDAQYERGETQSFYNDFFEVFGVQRRKVASFEHPVRNLPENKRGYIDLFWKGVLLVEQKSAGRKLNLAKTQAFEYFPGLKDSELPRYLLLSDFQSFELYDLELGIEVCFLLSELPDHVEAFGFIIGIERRSFRDQDPANIEASELMGQLHDGLKQTGYTGHDLERFLVRLLFCLFADDTGIFEPREIFTGLIEQRTSEDGADVGPWLNQLFEVLNTPGNERQSNLDEDLAQFPYVNGNLFAERLRTPSFNKIMRQQLLIACAFNWSVISPAIFGSLFQSVMDSKERRKKGAHYTTEKNILKVIQPLFLDDLRAEFQRLKERRDKGRATALRDFQEKLRRLKLFDPACGCGNFLVIAYRELRALELEILEELHKLNDQFSLPLLDVDQFYGIEIGEFPARIAEVAMWMTDHIANVAFSQKFGELTLRIPLKTSPNILHADALEVDWTKVLPPKECSFVFGNPPFIGAKYQSDFQRQQVRSIANLGKSGGTLDYVAAWFLKAGDYARLGGASIGFVATNSITQGEQVAQLWPLLFDRCGLEISFGHRTFAWGSDARGMAHVHVVILGLTLRASEPESKRLFSYDDIKGEPKESRHKKLSPYLIAAEKLSNPHLVIHEENKPLNCFPKLVIGSKPIDDGNFIFTPEEKDAFIAREPGAARFLRPFIGAEELINGGVRYILALHDATPAEIRSMPAVMERVEKVKTFRESSRSAPTRALANTPTIYHVNVIPKTPYLVIPRVSSEKREYAPIAHAKPPTIASDSAQVLLDVQNWVFALLTSRMHMAWLRTFGGRLESRYRYSIGIVYNTFPVPELSELQKQKLSQLGQAVLDARAAYPDSTLADLYDPTIMPADLRKAHKNVDSYVDKIYDSKGFVDDRHRAEHLLERYERMTTFLFGAPSENPKKPRKRRKRDDRFVGNPEEVVYVGCLGKDGKIYDWLPPEDRYVLPPEKGEPKETS